MSEMGLGRVKTQSRANRREKYSFGSPLCDREEHTELRCRGIREADSLPFARFHVFTQPGSFASVWPDHGDFRSTLANGHSHRRACLEGADSVEKVFLG
jgi:hypothetical protein